jgi:glycosyltransferase involved in cell wall biosynthesis
MRILLFDWNAGGHHALYLERLAAGLPRDARAIVAAPSRAAAALREAGIDSLDLGPPRPKLDASRHLRRNVARLAREDFARFSSAIAATRPTHAVHMFADGILREAVRAPKAPARVSLLLFRPRHHYPSAYNTSLSPRERALAAAYEILVRRWRTRADAHSILTLDEVAARHWAKAPGAPAVWLPEPPVLAACPANKPRNGAVVFGSLGPRKGLDRVVASALVEGRQLSLTLAGSVVPGFESELDTLTAHLRSNGASVDVRPTWHTEAEAVDLLADSRCAVLPYVDHYGMSRVLLEAAHAGTPVVVHDHGLLGHLVKSHRIGSAVDTRSPVELRRAIDALCHDPEHWERCHRATSVFVSHYSRAHFAQVLEMTFG